MPTHADLRAWAEAVRRGPREHHLCVAPSPSPEELRQGMDALARAARMASATLQEVADAFAAMAEVLRRFTEDVLAALGQAAGVEERPAWMAVERRVPPLLLWLVAFVLPAVHPGLCVVSLACIKASLAYVGRMAHEARA